MMLQAVIAGWVYNLHSMAELRRELLRNGSLRILVGISSVGKVPSEDTLSRFLARLAQSGDVVDELHARVVVQIRELDPGIGKHVAIDSTAINAWANGNRSQPADLDASWGCKGHKEKGESAWWFGYKEHLAVDTRAELVLAYKTTTASASDAKNLEPLLEKLDHLLPAGHLEAVMADAQYDSQENHEAIWVRQALPIIDHNDRGWGPAPGYTKEGCPLCDCGRPMRFLGRDRVYVKYGGGEGCTCREGRLIRRWRIDDDVRLHPPLPRHTKKWGRLYDERTAVERVNSRGKEHGRWRSLKHRGLAKAHVHCALTMLVQAAGCLGMMQAGRGEWARSVVRLVA